MNKYVLCVKIKVFEGCCFIKSFATITINCKHYLNTVVNMVIAKSTTFEVNLP